MKPSQAVSTVKYGFLVCNIKCIDAILIISYLMPYYLLGRGYPLQSICSWEGWYLLLLRTWWSVNWCYITTRQALAGMLVLSIYFVLLHLLWMEDFFFYYFIWLLNIIWSNVVSYFLFLRNLTYLIVKLKWMKYGILFNSCWDGDGSTIRTLKNKLLNYIC